MKTKNFFLFCVLIGFIFSPQPSMAQDLKKELDALDDLPEDDLSRLIEDKDNLEKVPTESAKTDGTQKGEEETPTVENSSPDLSKDLKEARADSRKEEASKPEEPSVGDALTGAANENTGKVVGLRFKQLPDRIRLTVTADRPLDYKRELRTSRRQVILHMPNMNISRSILRRALETDEFDGPVALIQAYESKAGAIPSTNILFQLRKLYDPTIFRSGNEIFIDFPIPENMRKRRGVADADKSDLPESFTSLTNKISFKGTNISLNVKNAPLPDILNLISKAAGKSFILVGDNKTPVTLNVNNMPWDQVLAIILINSNLGYQKLGNSYRVAPLSDLKKEIDDAASTEQKIMALAPLETRVIPLSYAQANSVKTNLNDFKSERGKISVDDRMNSLVVTDLPDRIDKMIRYIRNIDKQTSQVQIEARVVEASEDFSRTVGIDWKLGEVTVNRFADSFVNMGAKGGSTGGVLDNTVITDSGTGGAKLRIGNLGGIGSIQAILGFAEEEKKAKVIASPRVTVLNNKEATLVQGQSFYVNPLSGGGQNINTPLTAIEKNADTELKVTPQVTADGFVLLKVNLKRNLPNADTGVSHREATTEMLVESGKTGVVGGIYTLDKTTDATGWPLLRKFPIFGSLFQNRTNTTENIKELLMFISPKIVNSDVALAGSDIGEDLGRMDDEQEIDFSKLSKSEENKVGEKL